MCLCIWFTPLYLSSCRSAPSPVGLSDFPQRLLQWVLGGHQAPRLLGRVSLHQIGVGVITKCLTLYPSPSLGSGLAVCSCLSPVPCYKATVICSVKCRPQTEGQLIVRQQRHRVPPGPPPHTGSRAAAGPSVWPRSLPRPANAGVNASRHSTK